MPSTTKFNAQAAEANASRILSEATLDPDTTPDATETSSGTLSYNPLRLRIQLTLSRADCQAAAAPPADLVQRARDKMRAVSATGRIAFYVIYEKRLARIWQALRATPADATSPRFVTMTLAAGAPLLPGLLVHAAKADATGVAKATLALLSINAKPAETAAWRAEWLELHVARALRKAGNKGRPQATQIHGALLRAQAGKAVSHLPLTTAPRRTANGTAAFQLGVNVKRGEVNLILFGLAAIADADATQRRLDHVEATIQRLKGEGKGRFRLLKEHLVEAFARLRTGPETLGLGLPLTLLAAIDLQREAAPERETPGRSDGAGHDKAERQSPRTALQVAIDGDGMRATIAGFTPIASRRPGYDEAWLAEELRAAGIVYGTRPELTAVLLSHLADGRDVIGLEIATGLPPKPGAAPYLHVLGADDDAGTVVNMRAYRKQALGRRGEAVAEVRYREAAVIGCTVLGQRLKSPPPAGPEVQLGDGIRAEGHRYLAEFDGIVNLTDGVLTLQKLLVHEGDVNMLSGDIIFDGPVEITGDIESGAKVIVGGDLVVHGDVRGGRVRCKGNLRVDKAIVLGQGGEIRARGDVEADFIENSVIVCNGTVRAKKSILQCQVTAGGSIAIDGASGVIGGGAYTAGKSLTVANIGLRDGAKTQISVGTGFKAEATVTLRKARLAALQTQEALDRKTIRELARKRPEQLSKAEKSMKQTLTARLSRWSAILTKATDHLKIAETTMTFDPEARIFASGCLAATCSVKVAGRMVVITQDLQSVEITTEEKDGSYIHQRTA